VAAAHHRPLMREGLARSAEQTSGVQLVGLAEDLPATLALLSVSPPDVLILGRLRDCSSLDALGSVRACFPHLPVLAIGGQMTKPELARLVALGVRGYHGSDEYPDV